LLSTDSQIDFYTTFLGARIAHRNPQLAFLTYDDEHHRIALVNMPDISNKVRPSSGLEHVAFTFGSLGELLRAYKQRLEVDDSMRPVWCVNHRVTTSLYYKDLDGNMIGVSLDLR
jgi:catechol-2,3-dioxygenase